MSRLSFDEFRTDADDDVTPAQFLGAFLVFAICVVALFGWLVVAAATR